MIKNNLIWRFRLVARTGPSQGPKGGVGTSKRHHMVSSSNGLGSRPLTPVMWVRIPQGSPSSLSTQA